MEITKDNLLPYLLYNKPYVYNEFITLYPIKMKDIINFQQCQSALTVRKDSIFKDKEILKMEYLEFLKYACRNFELADEYNIEFLPVYYDFALSLLRMVCDEDAEIKYDKSSLDFSINDFQITDSVFNDLRKIIILQNDIDFDVNEFINIDTLNALEKAREFEAKKSKESANIEDYIDSLIVGLRVTEDYISNLTIRKFWRYIKRLNKQEEYQINRTAERSGMVTFKEPIQHWMTSIEVVDKYEHLKADEQEVRSKI